jgi:hypothetical protein
VQATRNNSGEKGGSGRIIAVNGHSWEGFPIKQGLLECQWEVVYLSTAIRRIIMGLFLQIISIKRVV